MLDVLVIIPTYNEKENIEKIINAVRSHNVDVLIVDDNSPDGTAQIVENIMEKDSGVQIIKRSGKLGLGSAYITGFKYAIEKGYKFVFEMDADFSHNPQDIPRFLEAIKDADLIIGSRYCKGGKIENWPKHRYLLSYWANVYARIVTGVPVQDLTAGFKCYRIESLKAIDLDHIKTDGYGFQIEIDVKIYRKGFKVKEIPVVFSDRIEGVSKMNKKIIWEAFWLVVYLRYLEIIGKI